MNRCIDCGKFRKWAELTRQFTPDNAFTGEDYYFICKTCYNKEKHRVRSDKRYKQDQNWLKKNLGMF